MDQKTVQDRRWVILGVLCLSLLVVVLDNTILNVALRTLQTDLGASQTQLEWIVDSYTLVFAALLFTAGVMGDRYGRRKILVTGMALFALASLASAFSGSANTLIFTRALMGIGGAAVLPSTLSIITNVFEPAERGKAIGIWAGFSGLAVAIGPVTGGALLEHFWWGSVFLINVPVCVFAVVALLVLVPESKTPNPGKFDVVGVVLSMIGLVTLVFGIIEGGGTLGWGDPLVIASLVLGVVFLALFAVYERHQSHPALDITLFKKPAFAAASGAIAMVFFALFGSAFFVSFYLQYVRDYSPLAAGARLMPVAIGLMVAAPLSSRLVARFGARYVCFGGLVAVTCALLTWQFIGVDTNIWVVEGLLLVQGLGMGNVVAPATESIMSTLPRDRAGAGSAVNNTTRQVGGALGVAVLGSVLSGAYRSRLDGSLGQLPEGARATARESIGSSLGVAREIGSAADGFAASAREAFMGGLHVTAACSATMAFLGALVVVRWLPKKQAQPAAAHPVAGNPVEAVLEAGPRLRGIDPSAEEVAAARDGVAEEDQAAGEPVMVPGRR